MWTEYLTLTLPYSPEMADIASKIGRGMDVDVGGAHSFNRSIIGYEADGETPIYGDTLTCTTGCTAQFKQQAMAMMADPALLHGAVAADYATRWPDLTPPTLAECEGFVAELVVS
jgi:hypothetical protein